MAMAPLTHNRAGEGNVPQAMNVGYYAQHSGAGLIIIEATQVSPQGMGYPLIHCWVRSSQRKRQSTPSRDARFKNKHGILIAGEK